MKYQNFKQSLEKAAEVFKNWDKTKEIRLISHLDADGIASCSIITNLLSQENRRFTTSIVPSLTREILEEFSREDPPYFIFSDLGSGQLKEIEETLKDKEVILLDHHELISKETTENITQVNPHIYGIDGASEISGSGVCYFFTTKINKKYEELSHIAIIGAIGDIQEKEGKFLQLNQEILDKAIELKKIKLKKSLRIFGLQTRQIQKALEYTSDPHIPGVSGSESGAVQFLQDIGINPKNGNRWKTISELNEEEHQRLVTGIIIKRLGEKNPEDILANNYILPHEKPGSPTRDIREFATLLNACGRMDRASCGIGTCLGIEKDRRMALQTSSEYKREIVLAIKWYEANQDKMIKGDGYVILNAKDEIIPTVIGTLASIMSKSRNLPKDTYIMSLARAKNDQTKVSLRSTDSTDENLDLREIVKQIVEKTGGEAGGHAFAAGAVIPTEKEEEFMSIGREIIKTQIKNRKAFKQENTLTPHALQN